MSANEQKNLHAFDGENIGSTKRVHHIPGALTHHYGTDFSGKITYQFNQLGFRGEDFNPKAKFHIFICGPSEGVGVGLLEHETWCFEVKRYVASVKQIPPNEVNLVNFSQAGASTDYVIRTLIAQASRIRPNLIIACPGAKNRTEYTDYLVDPKNKQAKRLTININPHLNHLITENRHLPTGKKLANLSIEQWDRLSTIVMGYYRNYTLEKGTLNQLRNYLLLQSFCRMHKIPFLIWSLARYAADTGFPQGLTSNLRQFSQSIDLRHTLKIKLTEASDFAADGIHPGRKSNRSIGRVICEKLTTENLIL